MGPTFTCTPSTNFKDEKVPVGELPKLGAWDPATGIELDEEHQEHSRLHDRHEVKQQDTGQPESDWTAKLAQTLDGALAAARLEERRKSEVREQRRASQLE